LNACQVRCLPGSGWSGTSAQMSVPRMRRSTGDRDPHGTYTPPVRSDAVRWAEQRRREPYANATISRSHSDSRLISSAETVPSGC
jgi:hypothetical protein